MNRTRSILLALAVGVLIAGIMPVAHSKVRLCFGKAPTIKGNDRSNVLRGTPNADVIHGLGGSDKILGLGGDDILCGGKGRDTLYGDDPAGPDPKFGSGRDSISGGPGNDKIHGNELDDEILAGNDGRDRIFGETGWDNMAGGPGNDLIKGGAPFGGIPDFGDEVFYNGAVGPVTVNLTTGRATGQGKDTLVSLEDITGSPFGDDLTGTVDQNFIYAGGGNDKVISKGDDSNTSAHDEVYGEDGDDYLDTVGGTGPHTVDSATGGNGTDSCLIDPNDVADCENVSNP